MELKRPVNIWKSNDTKNLGLSQLAYSATNPVVPQGTVDLVITKLFRFFSRNKNDKIKRSGLYQDQDGGGKCMTDTNIISKALKLAWNQILVTGAPSRTISSMDY